MIRTEVTLMSTPTDRLTNVATAVNQNKIEGVIFGLVVLPLVEFAYGVANLISAILGVFINPLAAFGDGLGGIVDALLGGPATILNEAARVTANSFSSGVWAQWGPFTWAMGIISILLGSYAVSVYLRQEQTSDWMPYSFTDLPFLGTDEEDEG